MSYSPVFARRELQQRVMPMLRATAERHRPAVEELSGGALHFVDLGAGRDVVDAPPAPRLPRTEPAQSNWCASCAANGVVWEPCEGKLWPVPCPTCRGWGSA